MPNSYFKSEYIQAECNRKLILIQNLLYLLFKENRSIREEFKIIHSVDRDVFIKKD